MLDSFTKQALTYLDVRGDILRTSFTIKLSILILCAFEVSNTAYPLYNDSLNPEKNIQDLKRMAVLIKSNSIITNTFVQV